MHAGKPKKEVTGILKEQLALLALLVLLTGTVSVERYYESFGLHYQFLDIPGEHLVYRGLTVVFDSTKVLILYFGAVIWLIADDRLSESGHTFFYHWRNALAYAWVLGLAFLGYFFSVAAGERQAERDMGAGTRLPKISWSSDETLGENCRSRVLDPTQDLRLLLESADELVLFVPMAAPSASATPDVIHVSKSCFKVFRVVSGD